MQSLLYRETRMPLHSRDARRVQHVFEPLRVWTARPTHASCTEDSMVEQSQVCDVLFHITCRYRAFDPNHAPPHVNRKNMRRRSRRAAEAATRRECCHPPVTHANIRACARYQGAARPRSATSGCQSVIPDAAEARHVAMRGWSILSSCCDGRLRAQRLCVPVNGWVPT